MIRVGTLLASKKLIVITVIAMSALLIYILYPSSRSEFSTDYEVNFSGKVIVVGAGAAGLTAAYVLERQGIEVQVIEAQDVYGGRMREATDFADFPIDLGAEWIHDDPSVLERIVANDDIDVSVETITYSPRDVYEWDGSTLTKINSLLTRLYSEYKFKDTTWFSFFDQHIVPPIKDKIVLSEPVSSIDYSGDQVVVSTVDGQTFEPKSTYTADRVLVTVPITVLQNRYITFSPALSEDRMNAVNSVTVPDGIKVFIEFSEKFYPEMLAFTEHSDDNTGHEKLYYDAAFGKDSSRNILGLFTVGSGAEELVDLTDDEVIRKILAELDEIYDGKASEAYQKHIIQNWTSTRFIEGSYSTEFRDQREKTAEILSEPLDGKVYFAGEAYSIDNQATVHGAAETAFAAVRTILSSE